MEHTCPCVGLFISRQPHSVPLYHSVTVNCRSGNLILPPQPGRNNDYFARKSLILFTSASGSIPCTIAASAMVSI